MGSRRKDIGRQSALRGAVAGVVLALGLGGTSASLADSALAWGNNYWGKLGNGSWTHSNVPVAATGLSRGVTAVAGGGEHSLAIQNGAAKAWGYNYFGQLGNGSGGPFIHSTVPVAVTGLSSGVTAVAAGSHHSLAIQNGAAKAWGSNGSGELGNGSNTDSSVPVAVTGLSSGVTAITAGPGLSLAIQNGAAKTWGSNWYGQLGNGSSGRREYSNVPVAVTGLSSGVTAVAAGSSHSLAIQNGAAKAWGANFEGQLGNGSKTDSSFPVAVTGLSSGVTAVAAGSYHSLAIQNGNVYAWGSDAGAALGNGAAGSSALPLLVLDRSADAVDVVASDRSSYALLADGSLWVWGSNRSGQLGLGDDRSRHSPTRLQAPTGYRFTGIDAGHYHAVATMAAVPESASVALLALGICVVFGRAHALARRGPRSTSA